MDLVKLANSPPCSEVCRGVLRIEVVPNAPSLPDRSSPFVDAVTVSAIVSDARKLVGHNAPAATRAPGRIALEDPFYDEQVQQFTAWAIKRVEDFQRNHLSTHDAKRRSPSRHAHCEIQLLSYIYRNKVEIKSYFGTSTATCANCVAMLDAYLEAHPQSPFIEVGKHTGKFLAELRLPEFEGDFASKYRAALVSVLQEEIGGKIIDWIDCGGSTRSSD